MDRRERSRDGDPDAGVLLALGGGLARAAGALAQARDDDLEVAVGERVALEEALAVDDQTGVRLAGDLLRLPVEADPGGGHDVGVDVVQKVGRIDVGHRQVDLARELATDELGILGQEENPFPGRQADDRLRFHGGDSTPPRKGVCLCLVAGTGSGSCPVRFPWVLALKKRAPRLMGALGPATPRRYI